MRGVGVVCVGLGPVLLIGSLFPLALGESPVALAVGVGVAGGLALPLTLLGVVLTRRAAARAGPEGERLASEETLRRASAIARVFRLPVDPQPPDPHGTFMERLRAFDLNRLTLAGWSLVALTAGLFAAGVILFARLVAQPYEGDLGPLAVLALVGGLALAAGFFWVGQVVFHALGAPITDKEGGPLAPPPRPLRPEEEDY